MHHSKVELYCMCYLIFAVPYFECLNAVIIIFVRKYVVLTNLIGMSYDI